jgi:hypothetical protein
MAFMVICISRTAWLRSAKDAAIWAGVSAGAACWLMAAPGGPERHGLRRRRDRDQGDDRRCGRA